MDLFWIVQIILLLAVFILLYLLSWFWPPDCPWSPWWTTNKKAARILCKMAKITNKDVVYDLGSGTGTVLMIAAQEFGATGVGVEIDPLRVYTSYFLIKFAGLEEKIKIYKQSFFKKDITEATVIFFYLIPKTIKLLQEKFLRELKPGTRIISYRYPIDYLPLITEDKKEKIYVYKIPNKKDL
ncbi:MAG TPA: 50S ribosomal protein L11 methyltransferase [Patescibacteria group bacterium]|nr:50S ribosomal protein L11 methyltransferase [Patescibacteria group bacterium]